MFGELSWMRISGREGGGSGRILSRENVRMYYRDLLVISLFGSL